MNFDQFMIARDSLGRSTDLGCNRDNPNFADPNDYSIPSNNWVTSSCFDYITLARHGIFEIPGPGIEGSRDYILANRSMPVSTGPTLEPPPPPDFATLQSSINECAKSMYGVELTGVNWSSQENDGKMDFKNINNIIHAGLTHNALTFSIYNDTHSYTSKQLNAWGISLEYTGGILQRTGVYQARDSWQDADGKQYNVTHWTNQTYTASDRGAGLNHGQQTFGAGLGFSGFIHTQIHEAGNALSALTGRNPDPAPDWNGVHFKDQDNGMSFESCVFLNYRKTMG